MLLDWAVIALIDLSRREGELCRSRDQRCGISPVILQALEPFLRPSGRERGLGEQGVQRQMAQRGIFARRKRGFQLAEPGRISATGCLLDRRSRAAQCLRMELARAGHARHELSHFRPW